MTAGFMSTLTYVISMEFLLLSRRRFSSLIAAEGRFVRRNVCRSQASDLWISIRFVCFCDSRLVVFELQNSWRVFTV